MGFDTENSLKYAILLGAVTYLFASINFSIILFKALGKGDPRDRFSGNAGTTNVARQLGKIWALLILLLDMGRAGAVAMIGFWLLPAGFVPIAQLTGNVIVGDIFAHTELLAAPVFDSSNERTRPNLKVQDGCDNRCSFCVIPSVRGHSRSLPLEQVLRTFRRENLAEITSSRTKIARYAHELERHSLLAMEDRRPLAVEDTAGWVRACGSADLVWLESPSNPLLTVADLEAICAAPRKPGTIVALHGAHVYPDANASAIKFPGTSLTRRPKPAAARRRRAIGMTCGKSNNVARAEGQARRKAMVQVPEAPPMSRRCLKRSGWMA